jgi:nitric oxide reductase subunit C
MSEAFTTSTARNIFYGGTLFFLLVFLALTYQTEQIIPTRDKREMLSDPRVVAGKKLWETNNCIGCHTLLGEGAYFAPELGNVVKRLGSEEAVKAFIQSRPTEGIPGRRSMPNFNFTDAQLDELAAFLNYVSQINTAKWPPNIQG